jgi:hypothetical protein
MLACYNRWLSNLTGTDRPGFPFASGITRAAIFRVPSQKKMLAFHHIHQTENKIINIVALVQM